LFIESREPCAVIAGPLEKEEWVEKEEEGRRRRKRSQHPHFNLTIAEE
jgi:hypothetical protein